MSKKPERAVPRRTCAGCHTHFFAGALFTLWIVEMIHERCWTALGAFVLFLLMLLVARATEERDA